jgi:intraflagellar transport protein 74
MRDVQFNSVGY